MKKILYKNGTIVTMNDNNKIAQAALIEDGVIKFVGTEAEANNLVDENTEIKDLNGTTMLPGFIDSHGHFFDYVPLFGNCTLAPPPIGDVLTLGDMKNKIRKYIDEKNIQPGEIVLALGYDNAGFEGKAHPTKFDLDEISTEHVIVVSHASGHMGSTNSLGLEKMELTSEVEDPQGGLYGRVNDTRELNGFFEETAFLPNVFKIMPQPTPQDIMSKLIDLQNYYTSYGITTCQDGMSTPRSLAIVDGASKAGLLKIDYVLYPGVQEVKDEKMTTEKFDNIDYNNKHFRLGGVKLFLDGSPQGRTAWLTEPYIPNGEQGEDYVAYPIFKDEEVYDYIKRAVSNNVQILTHVNGDAAIDQLQKIYRQVKEELNSTEDLRPVAIHSQIIREEQIDTYTELGMMPSYFVDHTYFYGDTHIANLGMDRARKISPIKTTIEKNVPYTFHQDTPVMPPNMVLTIHNAVNRVTRNGVVLGEEERVSTYDAIKGITLNAAYQYHEENIKGSIEVGKLADFVIVDKNPLELEIETIKDIKVLETIKEGNTVYSA